MDFKTAFTPEFTLGEAIQRCPRGMRVQSLGFDKNVWTASEARRWAGAHGYPTALDDKPSWTWMRIRVEDPKHFAKKIIRWGDEWLPGLKPIYGCPLKQYAEAPPGIRRKPKVRIRPKKVVRKVAGAATERQPGLWYAAAIEIRSKGFGTHEWDIPTGEWYRYPSTATVRPEESLETVRKAWAKEHGYPLEDVRMFLLDL